MAEKNSPITEEPAGPFVGPHKSKGAVPNFIKWTLAGLGACGAWLVIQVFVSLNFELLAGSLDYAITGSDAAANAVADQASLWATLLMDIITLVLFGLWWAFLRRRSLTRAHAAASRMKRGLSWLLRVAAIVLAGLAIQVALGVLLSMAFDYFPKVGADYNAMMAENGVNDPTALSLITVAFVAPVVEELVFRGVIFEFFLRAGKPDFKTWQRGAYNNPQKKPSYGSGTKRAAFLYALVMQAALFGLLHLNLVQSSYAFVMGLVLGWVYWRTGKLRYNMLLHLAINFSSYFVNVINPAIASFGEVAVVVVAALIAVAALSLFARTVRTEPLAA